MSTDAPIHFQDIRTAQGTAVDHATQQSLPPVLLDLLRHHAPSMAGARGTSVFLVVDRPTPPIPGVTISRAVALESAAHAAADAVFGANASVEIVNRARSNYGHLAEHMVLVVAKTPATQAAMFEADDRFHRELDARIGTDLAPVVDVVLSFVG